MNEQTIESKRIDNTTIILGISLLTVIFLIYRTYQTDLTGRTFLTNIYLYVAAALITVALLGRFTQNLAITESGSTWLMLILYFVLALGGISLMFSNNFYTNHIGFLMVLVAFSLTIGSIYRYSTGIFTAAMITAALMGFLTFIVYMSSDETLMTMASWSKYLSWILLIIIVIQVGYLFFGGMTGQVSNIMSILIIMLFVFFILTDTSKIMLKASNLLCDNHACVNYPLQSSGLVIDYFNIFVRLVSRRK